MKQFELHPRGQYSLAASKAFLEGFAPAVYTRDIQGDHLHLAFVFDLSGEAIGVCVREQDGCIVGNIFGEADTQCVCHQVARILSLDIDGNAFSEVGQRDPVIGHLMARYPGLRPVCFYSPYEAAAWALISHRLRIVQAARIKMRIAEELGTKITIHSQSEYAFPGPARLLELSTFPGLFGRKVEYLRTLAQATLDGKLDADFLRSLPVEEALIHLKQLPGIGDFSAQLILLRGAGEPDYLPTQEPRLGRAVTLAYHLAQSPSSTELELRSQEWRPYRTWTSFLLRAFLEEETHEIAGQAGKK